MSDKIRGFLLIKEGLMVDLAPTTSKYGGSWEGVRHKGYPVAYGQDSLQFVYDYFKTSTKQLNSIIDIGASTGSYSLLGKFLPNTIVTAFEPNPYVSTVLSENVKLNNAPCFINYCALGHKTQVGNMTLPNRSIAMGLAHMGIKPGRIKGDTFIINVPVLPLDNFSFHQVDFIKIDVEGYELRVLQGAEETVSRHRPIILMEFENRNVAQFDHSPEDVLSWLNNHQYIYEHLGDIDLICYPR